jgi:hypothetical protein
MTHRGVLQKMPAEQNSPIDYYLVLGSDVILMNQWLGQTLHIKHIGYQCLGCGGPQEIFRQGFCKKCFFEQPAAGAWVMHPELSQAHLGIEDRDLAYEQKVQLQPHIVYLAVSSHLKVGVTRKSQLPTRWIDQGADQALPILETPNRYLAGIAEVALKDHVSDKTNWRQMLVQKSAPLDLRAEKEQLIQFLPDEVLPYVLSDQQAESLDYPVVNYPQKVQSISLQKTPSWSGVLQGIKGQYLIFDHHGVFNVRAHEGYVVEISHP